MKINFEMWRTALWTLIKIEKKEEWDRLDFVSKWLIATRAAVTTVTIYSCLIAGMLAWRDGIFSWGPFLVVSLGLFIAHGTNNLLNDYTDFVRGVDENNYFRTQYGVHPLVNGFWTKKQQLTWFFVSGFLATIAGIYALIYTGFDPIVLALFATGVFFLLFYTYPLKYYGLGELSIFLIWGPVIIGGVYYVLTQNWNWNVVLAGVPFGLGVASINLAKHIDKLDMDKSKGVNTLPVVIGEKAARIVDMTALILIYAIIVYLIFVPRYFTPAMLLVLAAYQPFLYAFGALTKPRPSQPPDGFPAWPTWFSAFTFFHNRRFGILFIVGLLIDAILRIFIPGFWPAI